MIYVVIYMYLMGIVPWSILAKEDGVHKEPYVWGIIITWPLIPLWFILTIIREKYDDWKWERDYQKSKAEEEKKNPPPLDNETPTV
jgi:hypothetical protein